MRRIKHRHCSVNRGKKKQKLGYEWRCIELFSFFFNENSIPTRSIEKGDLSAFFFSLLLFFYSLSLSHLLLDFFFFDF